MGPFARHLAATANIVTSDGYELITDQTDTGQLLEIH